MKGTHSLVLLGLAALFVLSPAMADGQTLLQNSGFESPSILGGADVGANPDSWFIFSPDETRSCGISDRKKRSGVQSFFFKAHTKADYVTGMAQTFNVTPGRRYEFSVYAINDASNPLAGEAFGQVSIEWKNASGQELERTYGPTWTYELSPIRWERFLVGATAPGGAETANAVVTFYSKDSKGQGTCYIDEARLVDMEAPEE